MKRKNYVASFHDQVVRVSVRDVKMGHKFMWRGDMYILKEVVSGGVTAKKIDFTWSPPEFIGHLARVECFFSSLNWSR